MLGLSTVATPSFVLAGLPTRAVVTVAILRVLWLTNEMVWSVFGKYRASSVHRAGFESDKVRPEVAARLFGEKGKGNASPILATGDGDA